MNKIRRRPGFLSVAGVEQAARTTATMAASAAAKGGVVRAACVVMTAISARNRFRAGSGGLFDKRILGQFRLRSKNFDKLLIL